MNGYRTNWVVLCALVFLSASCGDRKSGDAKTDGGAADTNQQEDTAPPEECTDENQGTACDDGNPCTVNDACGGLGSCVGEATKVCPESDGNPCTEPRCDAELGSQDNDYCVESPITVSEAENACYKYSCADGVEEEMGISAGNKCGEWVVTEAGCIDHYVCDSQLTDSTDGSHCRPVSKAEGTPCLSEGVGIKAAPEVASTDSASSCWLYVCHTEPGPDTALTTAQCVLSSSLSAQVQSDLEAAGSKLSHSCSLDDMPDTISLQCNDWRCGCKEASCAEAECQVDPMEAKVGQACDNGNVCDTSVCMPAKGANPVMACESPPDSSVACDLFPDATCDVTGPCDSDTGCPNSMDIDASNAQCQVNNECIDALNTKCAPNDPNADPATGCVVTYLPVGSPCGDTLNDDCGQKASCQSVGESMKCEVTQWGDCDDGNACTEDSCADGKCQYTALSGTCDDADPCTTGDQCFNKACLGQPLDCNDNDVCTVDSCVPELGCTYFITDPNCGEPPVHDIEQMEGGSSYTCVRETSGEATCWGSSNYGKLNLPEGLVFQDISAGWNQTCVIDSDNNLLCWGIENGSMWDFGQVTDTPAGKFISVSGGFNHTCAVEVSGAVICWGISPATITDPTMDKYDDGQVTDAPAGSFISVASGHSHSCAIRSDGGIECWGADNPTKDTPTETNFVKLVAGYHHNCAIDTESKLTCWGWPSWSLVASVPAGTFQDVSCGYGHTCAVRTTGELECWGIGPDNPPAPGYKGVQDKGQVADAPTTGSFTHVGVGGSHSCAVTTAGKVQCWGNPLGSITTPPPKFQ